VPLEPVVVAVLLRTALLLCPNALLKPPRWALPWLLWLYRAIWLDDCCVALRVGPGLACAWPGPPEPAAPLVVAAPLAELDVCSETDVLLDCFAHDWLVVDCVVVDCVVVDWVVVDCVTD